MVNAIHPWLQVLGTAQDGGVPQVGCQAPCCAHPEKPGRRRKPACLAIVDPRTQSRWIIDATPQFPEQLAMLNDNTAEHWGLSGIFLTHAHIGHYVGLVHLGREVMGVNDMSVYAMERMTQFITTDAPWRQLVDHGHIQLARLEDEVPITLGDELSITPLLVPHRDEISETVGFRIDGPAQSALHIPDIDDWSDWKIDLEALLDSVDVAWLDGTFFDASELPGRDLKTIPHPLLVDSMAYFGKLPTELKNRIRFTHLNHSNPACDPTSKEAQLVIENGFNIATEGEHFALG